jgi:branched-chain amino acid transport system ATP-binding protein
MTSAIHIDDESDENIVLRTESLTKDFGGLRAVDSVDYELPADELRCLIGPNGAGKSTFFKLLSGQLQPTEGSIYFQGEEITNLEPYARARRGISLKFQNISVYPSLTVRENLRIPVQRHAADVDGRITELIELAQLNGLGDDIVDNLSHGQQQWLEIVMSMAIDPELLLLDEPTAGMSIEETRETGDLIQSLAAQGVSIVVVEHDINFVRQIADWVTVLHNGRLFAEGTVAEIEADERVQNIYLGKEEA